MLQATIPYEGAACLAHEPMENSARVALAYRGLQPRTALLWFTAHYNLLVREGEIESPSLSALGSKPSMFT